MEEEEEEEEEQQEEEEKQEEEEEREEERWQEMETVIHMYLPYMTQCRWLRCVHVLMQRLSSLL